MLAKTFTGLPGEGNSGNYSGPSIDWFQFIIKLAERCAAKHGLKKKARWRKYRARHYWEVIVYGTLNCLGTQDAAERWNALKWKRYNEGKRRKKEPRRLGGRYPRYERLGPDHTQVNCYKRQFSRKKLDKFKSTVFQEQLLLARELGAIDGTIDVFVDNSDIPYYGKQKKHENDFLHHVRNTKGTKRGRKYFGVMVRSGDARLFSRLVLSSKVVKRADYVIEGIDELKSWGFKIRRLTGDSAFVIRGLIDYCLKENIHYFGPTAKKGAIKDKIKNYLESGKCKVFQYGWKGKKQHQKSHPVATWIILHSEEKGGISRVRRKYCSRELSLNEAMECIRPFLSIKNIKSGRNSRYAAWNRMIRWYKKRWWIETGFRDLKEFMPPFHARTNEAKEFSMLLRVFSYNAWQIHRVMKGEETRKKQFCYEVQATFLCP